MRGLESMHQSTGIRYPRRNIIAIGLLLLITAFALVLLFKLVTLENSASQTSSYVTITGTPTCLPHKNVGPNGVTTLECALGLKGDDGRYYGLTDAPANLLQDDFGSRVKVRGILSEPASNSQYDIAGSIAVQSVSK